MNKEEAIKILQDLALPEEQRNELVSLLEKEGLTDEVKKKIEGVLAAEIKKRESDLAAESEEMKKMVYNAAYNAELKKRFEADVKKSSQKYEEKVDQILSKVEDSANKLATQIEEEQKKKLEDQFKS